MTEQWNVMVSCVWRQRYDAYRHILTEDFPGLDLTELLGTKKGLETFVKFLAKSGAFTKTGTPRGAPARPLLEDEEEDDEEESWWERIERQGNGSGDEGEGGGGEEDEEEEEDGGRGGT